MLESVRKWIQRINLSRAQIEQVSGYLSISCPTSQWKTLQMIESNKNSLFFIVCPTSSEDKRQTSFLKSFHSVFFILIFLCLKCISPNVRSCQAQFIYVLSRRVEFGRTPIVGCTLVNTNFVNANSRLNSISNLFFLAFPTNPNG